MLSTDSSLLTPVGDLSPAGGSEASLAEGDASDGDQATSSPRGSGGPSDIVIEGMLPSGERGVWWRGAAGAPRFPTRWHLPVAFCGSNTCAARKDSLPALLPPSRRHV